MTPTYIALICIGAVVLVAALALFIYLSNNLLVVTEYTVESPKLEREEVKIVQLSDLHAKSFGKGNRRLIKKVAAQSPDIIVITGDIIHKYREKDIAVANAVVKSLSEIAPTYYVSGNHEMRSKKYRDLKAGLEKSGACVLDDTAVKVAGVRLCGVNCASIKSGKFFNIERDEKDFNLLLAHLPQYIQRYVLAGFDCVLCGHAHGGQWRIPFTKIGIYSPGQGLFPKYTGGKFVCGDTVEIISRGLGNSQCPLRLFNPPELLVIELKKSK